MLTILISKLVGLAFHQNGEKTILLIVAARNCLPRCVTFLVRIIDNSIGIRPLNAMYLCKSVLAYLSIALPFSQHWAKLAKEFNTFIIIIIIIMTMFRQGILCNA